MKKTAYRSTCIAAVISLFAFNGCLFAGDTDERIESAAKQSYVFKAYLQDDDITVKSKDGVVTLTGTVSEGPHKSLAMETVAGLPGVKGVDNKLETKDDDPSVYSDAWLAAKVKFTLLFRRNVSGIQTEVLARDGIVTLRGKAASDAQRDLAIEYAKDVEGVKKVKNEMTVATAPGKPDGKTVSQKMDDMMESIDDASITALVKMTLLYHRSTSALNTTVETKDGVVTLGGEVRNAAEKDLAVKLVNDVHGVKRVVNNMTIGEIVSKTG